MSAYEVALAHAARRAELAAAVRGAARDAWGAVDPARISETWASQLGRLLLRIITGQRIAAGWADQYVTRILAEQGATGEASAAVNPDAFSDVSSDGRPLFSLLQQPPIVAKVALARGATIAEAMTLGGATAELAAHTQIADAGRMADQTALVTRRTAPGYVRMIVGETCARCLILAGRFYAWNAGFLRHPKCDCVHIPAADDAPGDLRTDPKLAFEALATAEQDKTFGKAGAEAIREGADIARVVNARRGMRTASVFGREVLATTELAGRGVRLMPEQIFADANGDRDLAIRLLRRFGYIR